MMTITDQASTELIEGFRQKVEDHLADEKVSLFLMSNQCEVPTNTLRRFIDKRGGITLKTAYMIGTTLGIPLY